MHPKLFKLTYTCINQKGEEVHSHTQLQIVADEDDLENAIENIAEYFQFDNFKVLKEEVEVGFSCFCHDVFISGYNKVKGKL